MRVVGTDKGTMKLILIRHGDPDYPNDSLTQLGHHQAAGLKRAFEQIPIDHLYSSPMGRARLTAEYVGRGAEKDPVVLDWLHELNGNYCDALWAWNQHGVDLFADAHELSPGNWADQTVYGAHMMPVATAFYGAFDRFMSAQGYERMGERYRVETSNSDVIVFACHAGVIQTLLAHLLNMPLPICYAQFGVDPSSRTTLVMEEKDGFGVFRMTGLNDMSHAPDDRCSVAQTGTFTD